MNCAGEDLALSKHSEAVGESGYVVLWSLIHSLEWLVTLQGKVTFCRACRVPAAYCLTLRGAVGSYLATE